MQDRGRKRSPEQGVNSQPDASSSYNPVSLVNKNSKESTFGRPYLPQLQIPKPVLPKSLVMVVEVRITFNAGFI
jgi:hypothetical protein